MSDVDPGTPSIPDPDQAPASRDETPLSVERDRMPPLGWNIAVAMLHAGLSRESVGRELELDLGLDSDEVEAAFNFAVRWVERSQSW